MRPIQGAKEGGAQGFVIGLFSTLVICRPSQIYIISSFKLILFLVEIELITFQGICIAM